MNTRDSLTTRAIERLLVKTQAVARIRDAHAGGEESSDLKAQLRALSREFPGVLREIDRMPREEITRRAAGLIRVLGGEAPALWMLAAHRTHTLLVKALDARRSQRSPRPSRIVPDVEAQVARELGVTTEELDVLLRGATLHRGDSTDPR